MSRLSKLFARSATRPAKARKPRLGVEPLEAREVMSAVLANGVLTVTGDDPGLNRADRIEILSPVNGTMVVRVNGQEQFSGSNAITQVIIDGRAGNDQVTISGVQSGITDGVVVRNSEVVTLGEKDPISGLFSMTDLRSDIRVENALFLNLKDTASTADRTIAVSEQAVTGMAPARISYTFGSGGNMSVDSGSGRDTFQITGTPSAKTRFNGGDGADTFDLNRSIGAVEINGQGGADTIDVAATSQSLSLISGRLTINDGTFQDRVTIHDERTGGNVDFFDSYTATLKDNQLALAVGARTNFNGLVFPRSFNRTIDFNGVDSVDYRAATAAATTSRMDIESVARFTETQVDAGGVHTIELGSAAHTLDGILGRTTITGGLADSRVILDDAGQIGGRSYRVSSTRITQPIQLGERTIDYGAYLGRVEVEAGSANDQFRVDSFRADGRGMILDGNGGSDSLTGPNQANQWDLALAGFGSLDGQVVFKGMDSLIGRGGDDTFHFQANGRVSGRIDGGGGFDTLDYSARTTPVAVNLVSGAATSVAGGAAGGVVNIRNVFGGSAGDSLTGNNQSNVLVGNGGIDTINGGTLGARDVLIGGTEADRLATNGSGDTLYVGGDVAAADRNNVASMKAILTEWLRQIDLATRVQNLANGVGSGGAVKLSATVLDGDLAGDTYVPFSGHDAFYRETVDSFSGNFLPGADEQVISV